MSYFNKFLLSILEKKKKTSNLIDCDVFRQNETK